MAWLASMGGRVFIILLFGVALAAGLGFTLADMQRQAVESSARDQRLVDRLSDLASMLDRAPGASRPRLLGPGPEAPIWTDASTPISDPDATLTGALAGRLPLSAKPSVSLSRLGPCAEKPPPPALRDDRHRPPVPPPAIEPPRPKPPTCRWAAFTLESGERVAVILPSGPAPPNPTAGVFNPVFLTVIGFGAAGLAFIVARLATAPLSRLARAAEALGDDLERPALSIEGPQEVRRAAQAFNTMQRQLKRHLAERTQMLAAITHDLQTPLTRQRLRLEKVSDVMLRDQLLADHAAMQVLIREGLDLARASSAAEAWEDLDVDSLLDSLCDDASDAGLNVRVVRRSGAVVRTRPQALKRCMANLLDNAIKYAGDAELAADQRDGRITLKVQDRGPGIATEAMQAVLEPFVRLETSRSRATGGVGLGLSIAQLLADRAGATLHLANREGGGLEASLEFGLTSALRRSV